MKAIVDQDACIGCALCVSICEEVFHINENGLSEMAVPAIEPEHIDAAQEAADLCPVACISIE